MSDTHVSHRLWTDGHWSVEANNQHLVCFSDVVLLHLGLLRSTTDTTVHIIGIITFPPLSISSQSESLPTDSRALNNLSSSPEPPPLVSPVLITQYRVSRRFLSISSVFHQQFDKFPRVFSTTGFVHLPPIILLFVCRCQGNTLIYRAELLEATQPRVLEDICVVLCVRVLFSENKPKLTSKHTEMLFL